MTIYIGTSGIALPFAKKDFPEEHKETSRLRYYSTLFNSLEVNSSFYKTPQSSTFAKWAEDVNDGFRFTVKFTRAVTHTKNLDFDADEMTKFLTAANTLGKKRGALLVQFPASISVKHRSRVENLLNELQEKNATVHWQIAVEFRHASWYSGDTIALLKEAGASLVIHDMPGSAPPTTLGVDDFLYVRFHGPTGDYKGSYSREHLQQWASWMMEHASQNRDVYAYFNNTMGDAHNNARLLQAQMQNS